MSAVTQSWHSCVLIRYTGPVHHGGMATLAQKIEAEQKMRGLLEENGLPEPSRVEYGFTCIRLFFEETKTVVIIDIDQPPPVDGLDTDAV
jgi:hypothetical protein